MLILLGYGIAVTKGISGFFVEINSAHYPGTSHRSQYKRLSYIELLSPA
jgi:hypothetical protein